MTEPSLTFPPPDGPLETAEPPEGWDLDALDRLRRFARSHRTSGLIVLDRGRVVVEDHWPMDVPEDVASVIRFETLDDGRTIEDVASVQKSITSVLVGIALGRGLLALDDPVVDWLGPGWSRAPAEHEARITIRDLMSMTSGLDDGLEPVARPGEIWDYNLGAGYHVLKRVVTAAAGSDLDAISRQWLLDPLGMAETAWSPRSVPDGLPPEVAARLCYPDGTPLEGLATTARDLARFGLAMLAGGRWGEHELGLADGFLAEAWRPSTALNPSYGLLWWINGQDFQLAPKRDAPIDGWLLPDAPGDTVAALGALGRAVYVVPSRALVIVRIGLEPGEGSLAANRFGRELWARMAEVWRQDCS